MTDWLNLNEQGIANTLDEKKERLVKGLRNRAGGCFEVKPTFIDGGYEIRYQGKMFGQIEGSIVVNQFEEVAEIEDVQYIGRTVVSDSPSVPLYDSNKRLLLVLYLKRDEVANSIPKAEEKFVPQLEGEITPLLSDVFPDIDWKICTLTRSEEIVFDKSLIDSDVPEGTWIPFDDKHIGDLLSAINNKFYAAGYRKGRDVPKNKMIDILETKAHKNRFDPIKNVIEDAERTLPEMSIPELRHGIGDLFRRTLGAYVTDFTDAENVEYVDTVSTAWILGGVARMVSLTSIEHFTIPILIGQQKVGKSKTLQWASIEKDWCGKSNSRLDSDKGLEEFRHTAEKMLVVELAEGETYTRTSDNFFKAFVSRGEDTFRKAYGRTATTYIRRYILAMTSNHKDILVDQTGNRRFYPLFVSVPKGGLTKELEEERTSFETRENAVRIWAMGMRLYRILMEKEPESEPWNLDANWELGKRAQELCLKESLEISDVKDWIDTFPKTMEEGAEVTKKDVLFFVFGNGIDVPKCSAGEKAAVNTYFDTTTEWDRKDDKKKDRHGIKGYPSRIYYVRISPSPTCEREKTKPSHEPIKNIQKLADAATEYALKNNIVEGDVFTMPMTEDERKRLVDLGGIDEQGRWLG